MSDSKTDFKQIFLDRIDSLEREYSRFAKNEKQAIQKKFKKSGFTGIQTVSGKEITPPDDTIHESNIRPGASMIVENENPVSMPKRDMDDSGSYGKPKIMDILKRHGAKAKMAKAEGDLPVKVNGLAVSGSQPDAHGIVISHGVDKNGQKITAVYHPQKQEGFTITHGTYTDDFTGKITPSYDIRHHFLSQSGNNRQQSDFGTAGSLEDAINTAHGFLKNFKGPRKPLSGPKAFKKPVAKAEGDLEEVEHGSTLTHYNAPHGRYEVHKDMDGHHVTYTPNGGKDQYLGASQSALSAGMKVERHHAAVSKGPVAKAEPPAAKPPSGKPPDAPPPTSKPGTAPKGVPAAPKATKGMPVIKAEEKIGNGWVKRTSDHDGQVTHAKVYGSMANSLVQVIPMKTKRGEPKKWGVYGGTGKRRPTEHASVEEAMAHADANFSNKFKSDEMAKAKVDEGKSPEEKVAAREARNPSYARGNPHASDRHIAERAERGVHRTALGAGVSKLGVEVRDLANNPKGSKFYQDARAEAIPNAKKLHAQVQAEASKIKPNLPKSEEMEKGIMSDIVGQQAKDMGAKSPAAMKPAAMPSPVQQETRAMGHQAAMAGRYQPSGPVVSGLELDRPMAAKTGLKAPSAVGIAPKKGVFGKLGKREVLKAEKCMKCMKAECRC